MQLLKVPLAVTLVIALILSSADITYAYSNADQFWQVFRQAIIHNNIKEVASLTRFPLEVHGEVDSDPVVHYDRKDFPQILKRLITQPVFLPSGGSIIWKSMLHLVEEKKKLLPGDYLTSDIIRIEDFEFNLIKGHWFFTKAYLGD